MHVAEVSGVATHVGKTTDRGLDVLTRRVEGTPLAGADRGRRDRRQFAKDIRIVEQDPTIPSTPPSAPGSGLMAV